MSMPELACVVIEQEDMDMSAVVSSLVQLILDDQCRTVSGFQDLIDREWIALGHRWLTRYNASSADKVAMKKIIILIVVVFLMVFIIVIGIIILQLQ